MIRVPFADIPPRSRTPHSRPERTRDPQTTNAVITHRNHLLHAPCIPFSHAGKLAGDDTHDQLLQTCTPYADAYLRWQLEEKIEN